MDLRRHKPSEPILASFETGDPAILKEWLDANLPGRYAWKRYQQAVKRWAYWGTRTGKTPVNIHVLDDEAAALLRMFWG